MLCSVKNPAIVPENFFDITPSVTMNCSFGSWASSALEKMSEVHYMSSETPVPPNFKSARIFSETFPTYELWPEDCTQVLAKICKKCVSLVQ